MHVFIVDLFIDEQQIYSKLRNILQTNMNGIENYYMMNQIKRQWVRTTLNCCSLTKVNWIKIVRFFKRWNPIVYSKNWHCRNVIQFSKVFGVNGNQVKSFFVYKKWIISISSHCEHTIRDLLQKFQKKMNIKFNIQMVNLCQRGVEKWNKMKSTTNIFDIILYFFAFTTH